MSQPDNDCAPFDAPMYCPQCGAENQTETWQWVCPTARPFCSHFCEQEYEKGQALIDASAS